MQPKSPAGSGAFQRRTIAAGCEPPRAADSRSGYLLIEVAVTLAITGMVMAMVFPFVGTGTTPARLAGLITASAALLREARTAAISRNVEVAATFDAPRRRLRAGPASILIPPDVDFSVVAGGNCSADRTGVRILFRPDGTNCGGVLRFAKGRRIARARVNWVDGQIDVVEGP